MPTNSLHEQGRLRSRPGRTPEGRSPVGLRSLRSDTEGSAEGYLYVPPGYRTETPAPLVLLLHGAGEDARDGLAQLRGQADEPGIILLALSSRGPTWDSILDRGRYGADIAAIDRVLEHTFSRCAVDPTRVAVGGYSDGASYRPEGLAAYLCLARDPGQVAPDRLVQPQDRPPTRTRWI
jgi:phospholipase/carboxylesterase